jgi:hypothetical protein
LESQIVDLGLRTGLTKSAVIVRSIQEYMVKHAAPSSLQIYEEAMAGVTDQSRDDSVDLDREASQETRTVKCDVRNAIRSKHAQRSARASQALEALRGGAATSQ